MGEKNYKAWWADHGEDPFEMPPKKTERDKKTEKVKTKNNLKKIVNEKQEWLDTEMEIPEDVPDMDDEEIKSRMNKIFKYWLSEPKTNQNILKFDDLYIWNNDPELYEVIFYKKGGAEDIYKFLDYYPEEAKKYFPKRDNKIELKGEEIEELKQHYKKWENIWQKEEPQNRISLPIYLKKTNGKFYKFVSKSSTKKLKAVLGESAEKFISDLKICDQIRENSGYIFQYALENLMTILSKGDIKHMEIEPYYSEKTPDFVYAPQGSNPVIIECKLSANADSLGRTISKYSSVIHQELKKQEEDEGRETNLNRKGSIVFLSLIGKPYSRESIIMGDRTKQEKQGSGTRVNLHFYDALYFVDHLLSDKNTTLKRKLMELIGAKEDLSEEELKQLKDIQIGLHKLKNLIEKNQLTKHKRTLEELGIKYKNSSAMLQNVSRSREVKLEEYSAETNENNSEKKDREYSKEKLIEILSKELEKKFEKILHKPDSKSKKIKENWKDVDYEEILDF